jgi:hypothetical protein
MRLVLVESPYAGTPEEITRNEKYARACLADCLAKGEAPFASHLLYTQPSVLRDGVPEERALGIEAGLAWGDKADLTAVYVDLGVSLGMLKGIERANAAGRPIETRKLYQKYDRDAQPLPEIPTVGPEPEALGLRPKAIDSGSAASSAHRGYPSSEGSPGEGLDDAGRSSSDAFWYALECECCFNVFLDLQLQADRRGPPALVVKCPLCGVPMRLTAETIVLDAVTTLSGFGWRVAILASPLNRPQLRGLELRLRSPLVGVGPVAYDLFEVPRVAAHWLYGRPQETPPAAENTNVLLDYTNHRGERGIRPVTPVRIWFGATTWHPVPGWLLEAFDLDKRATRDFAMASVHSMLPFAR